MTLGDDLKRIMVVKSPLDLLTSAIEAQKTPAFLTGSRAYGTPRPDSDIDIVVLIEATKLLDLLERYSEIKTNENAQYANTVFKFGTLNLIPVGSRTAYDRWKKGTDFLIQHRPVSRTVACRTLRRLVDSGLPVSVEMLYDFKREENDFIKSTPVS